jgi:Protein of unknown function (DUF3485)
MKSILLSIALILTTGGVGYWHGKLSARWGVAPDVQQAGAKLHELPETFGDWKLYKEEELAKEAAEELHCYSSVQRVYIHEKSGVQVSFVILFGPVGPISVHTPEICYSSSDYSVATQREPMIVPATSGENDQLWDLRLKATRITGQPLRVVYGWTSNGIWQASKRPRFSFAGQPYLYKLQIAMVVPPVDSKFDYCEDFLQAFLPVVRPLLLKPSAV